MVGHLEVIAVRDARIHEGPSVWEGGSLTVGDLRALLARVPADTHVVIATDGWYDCIGSIVLPSCPTNTCCAKNSSNV